MYPLLAFSVISAAVIIEKTADLLNVLINGKVFSSVTEMAAKGDRKGVIRYLEKSAQVKTNRALQVLKNTASGLYGTENGYNLAISQIMMKNSERIHLLDLVGKISPMTGLTGTVIGLARAFQSVSSSGRTGDAALLAGGIWEAMITTIAGLLIAIPAIIAAHLLRNSFKKHADRLRHCCDAVSATLETGHAIAEN